MLDDGRQRCSADKPETLHRGFQRSALHGGDWLTLLTRQWFTARALFATAAKQKQRRRYTARDEAIFFVSGG
jgi:hypothetical protein